MRTDQHHFVVEVAIELGMDSAVVLNSLHSWCVYNKANDKNFHDGNYWTYNTTKSLAELFPYLSQTKVYRAIRALEGAGYIISGNYNKKGYDRTKWYALTEKGYSMYGESILQGCNNHFAPVKNGFCTSETPIPMNNTKNKPKSNNNAQFKEEFEHAWSLYPRKIGKQNALKAFIKARKEGVDVETIESGIRSYTEHIKANNTEERFIKHGSTYFNQRCWDDEYETKQQTIPSKPTTAFAAQQKLKEYYEGRN